jgi:HAD superfamily hydrolase (TIGR01484 family)
MHSFPREISDAMTANDDRHVLATDLDGTLIPLEGNRQNRADLASVAAHLSSRKMLLAFVTGRHFESVSQAIREHGLPLPDWIICDVGTSVFRQQASGEFASVEAYQEHLGELIASLSIDELKSRLKTVQGLRIQEPEKQGRFKLSYYADASRLDELVALVERELRRDDAPYSIIHSVDPFTGDGLIDLLPAGVSKAYALAWWTEFVDLDPQAIIFAGDSGNDLAALTAGYRAILVGNADPDLARRVTQRHHDRGWKDRLLLASNPATSGVLEGLRWFQDS